MTCTVPTAHTCPGPCKECALVATPDPGQEPRPGRVSYFGLGQQNRCLCPGPCPRCGHITLNGAACHDCLRENWLPARAYPKRCIKCGEFRCTWACRNPDYQPPAPKRKRRPPPVGPDDISKLTKSVVVVEFLEDLAREAS